MYFAAVSVVQTERPLSVVVFVGLAPYFYLASDPGVVGTKTETCILCHIFLVQSLKPAVIVQTRGRRIAVPTRALPTPANTVLLTRGSMVDHCSTAPRRGILFDVEADVIGSIFTGYFGKQEQFFWTTYDCSVPK